MGNKQQVLTLLSFLLILVGLPVFAENNLPLKLQYIENMLIGSSTDDERMIMDNKALLEKLPKPAKGEKKVARKANDEALVLIKAQAFEQAVPLLAKAHQLDPSDIEVLNNYGFVLMKSRNLEKAWFTLADALAMKPDRASGWRNFADVLALQGKIDSAVAGYMNAYRFSKNREKTHQLFQNPQLSEDSPYVREAIKKATEKATRLFFFQSPSDISELSETSQNNPVVQLQYPAPDLQPKQQQQLENKQPAINAKSIESIIGIIIVIIFGVFIYMARGFLINVAALLGGIYGIYYALTSDSIGWGVFSLIASLIGGFNVFHMIHDGDIFEEIGSGTSSDLSSHNSYSSQGMGSDSIDSHSEVLVGTQKAGTLYEGSSWLTEEKTGRTDEEGNIYKGSSWLTEEKTGRIDEEGDIYKGSSWLTEEKAGRIDEEGNIYKGSSWLTEEKVGRVDEEGNIYKGSSWLTEEKVGRVEKNDK